MADEKYEFRYLEFIRNPQIKESDIDSVFSNIQFIALDYFDFIYTKKVDSFTDCMVAENDIPCEAYQSIGLFRKEKSDEKDIMDVKYAEFPFMAIIQITKTPESYQFYNDKDYCMDITELERTIEQAAEIFFHDCKEKKRVECRVYQTVNTMDYCILVLTDRMGFSVYLSNKIKEIEKENVPKYSVYTNMAIYKDFDKKFFADKKSQLNLIGNGARLVARVHLKRNIYNKNNLRQFIALSKKECTSNDAATDTHILTGRYDLSIRMYDSEKIIDMLPLLMKFIIYSFTKKTVNFALIQDEKSNIVSEKNMLKWLIKNDLVEYINARIFFNCELGFNGQINEKNLDVDENNLDTDESYASRKALESIADQFNEIKKNIENIENPNSRYKFAGFMNKLHYIVHIYTALYSRYDTNISINMLGDYLTDFMALLKMYINFLEKDKVDINDLSLNFSWGINYLHQFINVVTSVNSSSFESPKYEAEKDECSIVKLPIAYTEMINEVFEAYYNMRKKRNDEEFKYFPQYKPLVIPYMQGLNQNFSMMTLFSQNMLSNWDFTKDKWEVYNNNNGALMYIICEDMNQYKNISNVIISAFHEVGHYCNAMTREQRNSDALKIVSEVFSKSFIKRILSNANVHYDILHMALCQSHIIQNLSESINSAFIKYFEKEMNKFRAFPKNIYLGNLYDKISEITYVFADYNDNAVYNERFNPYVYGAEYMFSVKSTCENENKICDIYKELLKNCNYVIDQIKEDIDKIQNSDNDEKERLEWKLTEKYIDELKSLLCHNLLEEYENNSKEICSKAAEISSIAKKIRFNNILNLFKQAEQTQKYNIVKNLRENMQYTIDITNYILKIITNYYSIQSLSNANCDYCITKSHEVNVNKKEFIDIILDYYLKTLVEFSEKNKVKYNGFTELYSDLHLCPTSDKKELCSLLNNSLKGIEISSRAAELAISSYDEGIADVIMCLNLGFEILDYIIFLSDTYNKDRYNYEISGDRLVIVTAFLFIKERNYIKNDYHSIIEILKNEYIQEIEKIRDGYVNSVSEEPLSDITDVFDLIISSCMSAFDKKIFRITFERIKESYDNMVFVDSINYLFVKDMLKIRANQKDKNSEKYSNLQNKEIEFILLYYYRNRKKYSNLRSEESNESKSNQNCE